MPFPQLRVAPSDHPQHLTLFFAQIQKSYYVIIPAYSAEQALVSFKQINLVRLRHFDDSWKRELCSSACKMLRAVCSLNSLFYLLERKAEIKRGGIEESGHTRGQIEQESAHTTGTLVLCTWEVLGEVRHAGYKPSLEEGGKVSQPWHATSFRAKITYTAGSCNVFLYNVYLSPW